MFELLTCLVSILYFNLKNLAGKLIDCIPNLRAYPKLLKLSMETLQEANQILKVLKRLNGLHDLRLGATKLGSVLKVIYSGSCFSP